MAKEPDLGLPWVFDCAVDTKEFPGFLRGKWIFVGSPPVAVGALPLSLILFSALASSELQLSRSKAAPALPVNMVNLDNLDTPPPPARS